MGFEQVMEMIETTLEHKGLNVTFPAVGESGFVCISLEADTVYEGGGTICYVPEDQMAEALEVVRGMSSDIPDVYVISFSIRVCSITGTGEY